MKNANRLFLVALFFIIFFTSGLEFLRSQEFLFDPTAKITMDFKDANIKDILKVFSVQSGTNFIASSALQDRTLTLYLNNVAIEDAINQIFKANNLSYDFIADSNIYIVKDMGGLQVETITRVYKLKYARVENSWINDEIDKKLNPENAQDDGATTTTTTTSSSSSTLEKEEYGLTKVIKRILTENGKIVEDRRTNSLIITDVPANFSRIEAVIAQLDVPAPQVLIQVEMLDVSKQTADELGIDWSGVWMNLTGAARTTRFPFPERMSEAYLQAAGQQVSQVGTIGQGLTTAGTVATNTALVKTFTMGTLTAAALTAALRFIETRTDSKYLARPRIMCMNNELAEIKITTNESVGVTTGALPAQAAGAGAVTQISAPERTETGVRLRVAPQINLERDEITMYVEPMVKEAAAGNTIATAAGNFTYRDPEERSTKSTLRIKDGETIVIGGLLRTRNNERIEKIPILSKIPFLGKLLFTYHVGGSGVNTTGPGREDQRELLVFITPHIVKDDALMQLASTKTIEPIQPKEPLVIPVREQAPLTKRQKTISDTLKNFE